MPDQSSAAEEHALLEQITAPLSRLPDDPVPLAAEVDFPVVLRGYDRMAVDAYVQRTSELVAELQATRSPEGAIRRALERVGEQISGILQRAHETAAQITQQSRAEAEERLERARAEADSLVAAAEQRVRELDGDADRIWGERARIIEDARELAGQLTQLSDAAAERFPPAESTGGETISVSRSGRTEEDEEGEFFAEEPETDAAGEEHIVFDAEGEAPLPTGETPVVPPHGGEPGTHDG